MPDHRDAPEGIFDYRHAVDGFFCALVELREHIVAHDFIADAEDVAKEIDHATGLFDSYTNALAAEDEQRLWNEMWNYVRDNAQKWWD